MNAFAARRRRLAELVDQPVLVSAGHAPARNYAGNPYPFRASSHFLYLVGEGIAGARLLVDGDVSTLYVPPVDPDDALWHGPAPDRGALAARVGCHVRDDTWLPNAPEAIELPDAQLADAMLALRLVHDDAAIDGLRRAAEGTTAAHLAGMAATRPGLREWAVLAEMEAALARRGMTTAYQSILTVHGEVLHNHAHHHALAPGDLVLADVGAETHDGWAGDVTRTWPATGRFSDAQRAIYDVVLASQKAAIDAVGPGVRYRDVHLTAARVITEGLVELGVLKGDVDGLLEDGVHALFFPHGVGHLIGLDVHDMEDLGDRAGYAPGRERSERFGLCYLRLDRDLEPGMAVTIEPGFYQVPAILSDPELTRRAKGRLDLTRLEDFADVRGIRIEDDVLVTETGREVLTAGIPKEADEVERAVGG